MFKSVGLVARYDKKESLKLAEDLATYLSEKNLKVYLEETLKGKVKNQVNFIPLADIKTDFLITIGGDGTILRTCIALSKPEPPILTINMGVRGFLTEIEPAEAFSSVDKILKGAFKIQKCMKLAALTEEGATPDALNDVVVSGGEPSKILYLQVYKDEKPIMQFEADGLIVSTRTGSTGYTLSAGGPALDPQIEAIVVTPICSLTVLRSLVLPADCTVTVKTARPKDMLVLIDGNYRRFLPAKNTGITVRRSENITSFIRFRDDFYSRLQKRLTFKGMGC